MLTEICQYLHNYFDRGQIKYHGEFTINDGQIFFSNSGELTFLNGQYFCIIGSVLNDGVHRFPADDISDETFEGTIFGMAIPKAVLTIADEIQRWMEKYGGLDSYAMSPFQSESFGGYSYSKSGAVASDGSLSAGSWQSVYGRRLSQWRKLP